jgi:ubiquinone/menaquinone biosynthesis C-methylase UbiE
MPDSLSIHGGSAEIADIDGMIRQTHDEHARTRAVAVLHNHALMNLRFQQRDILEREAGPAFEKAHGHAPRTEREIADAMEGHPFYRFYSAIRYNAQEMGPLSRVAAVERALPQMIEVARDAARLNPAGGSLRLNPDLEIPRYVTALDVHLAPGCYHSEYTEDDVAQGALLGAALSGMIGAGRVNRARNFAGIGESIGYWLKQRYPDFRPRRVLDLGTQSGNNLLAYRNHFPGIELYGVDVAAPCLRYGHAKAEHAGIPVHFSQQNAESTDFPDGHFDLIVASFFFHELSVAATRNVLKEAYRLLAPGGVLAPMELPPRKACDPFMNFAFDWDTRNNNEPFYASYRAQDPTELCVEAGFPRENAFEIIIPDVTTFDMTQYPAFLRGEIAAPRHGGGGWFIFGSRKEG